MSGQERAGDELPILELARALRSGSLGRIRWDEFMGAEVLEQPGGSVSLDDAEVTRLLIKCEQLGLSTLSRPQFRQLLHMVAKDDSFDSAQQWLDQLPAWDSKSRVERFLPDYLGTACGAYENAVGRYLWTAMVARILEPGCKADMVPVLVGKQGVGKSTLLANIAPTSGHFGDACLTDRSSHLARKVLGKVVVAWEELRGIRGRTDADEVKTFISSPYVELPGRAVVGMDRHPRRFVLFGTSNRRDFLRDATGHRRYLPFDVQWIHLEKVIAEKEQLWAEALHMVQARRGEGKALVDYEEAERLAVGEHQNYLDQARWVDDDLLLNWLRAGNDRFRTEEAMNVVGLAGLIRRADRSEMVKSLRQLGLEYKPTHIKGRSGRPKRWHMPRNGSQPGASRTWCP